MNKNKKIFLTSLLMALTITGCNNNNNNDKKTYNNDEDALIFAITDLDGLFNPFYYSSGNDGSIIGMTQISMFTTDKNAKIAYGDNEPVVVKDYSQVYDKEKNQTTYTFVIKNPESKVRFSNGSYLTMKDVLFNLYEYLDPAYTGSSTMYSTDILGLKEYRTQQATEAGQDAFAQRFNREARERINALVTVLAEIDDEKPKGTLYSIDDYKKQLTAKASKYANNQNYPYASKFVEDFIFVSDTFKGELKTDYQNSAGTYEKEYGFTNIDSFLYTEGLILIDLDLEDGDPDKIQYVVNDKDDPDYPKTMDEAINLVYDYYFPSSFATIVNYWSVTAPTVLAQFEVDAKSKYFESLGGNLPYKNISGVKVIEEDTTVNGTTYKYARYNENGEKVAGADNGYEMFSITIDGVDPKAIWNFSFTVAPMYYYSSEEQIKAFDYKEHFGVAYNNSSFQKDVIKGGNRISLPVGAGAYQASDNKRSQTCSDPNEFKKDNVVYFVRNDNFLMGAPKIKYIRYQVIPQNDMLSALEKGQVHYCEPQAKEENTSKIKGISYLDYSTAQTLGYGYIGINPKYVPSIYTRRAIMTTMDTTLSLAYYPGTSEAIYRPMSKVSWAYPQNCDPYYAYDETGQEALKLLEKAGYVQNSKGLLVDNEGKQLTLKYTLAGDSTDHPAANVFYRSQDILKKLGAKVDVTTDVNALTTLADGGLAIWAAAWSSTIDPDMYQVYHKKSQATSTKNWGYNVIEADTTSKYATERDIIDKLSEKIEEGRETLDQNQRISIYANCLDLVMELAVELPTYQRSDLFAYNSSYLDASTMTPKDEVSPYNGPINQIWNLSLVTK